MLQINRQTDYAVRVVLALAKRPKGTRLSSGAIQREMLIPKAFVSRIVAQLASNGLVRTFAGREGGLELPRPASEITLKDVVEVFERPVLLSQCLQPTGEGDCPFINTCPVRSKWGRVQTAMLHEMETITFEDLANEAANLTMVVSTKSL